jgi:hypothetical protein
MGGGLRQVYPPLTFEGVVVGVPDAELTGAAAGPSRRPDSREASTGFEASEGTGCAAASVEAIALKPNAIVSQMASVLAAFLSRCIAPIGAQSSPWVQTVGKPANVAALAPSVHRRQRPTRTNIRAHGFHDTDR